MWLLSEMEEGQYYKFIPDQAVEAMGIANYAASDLFNSSGCECLVGLLHLLFQGLLCSDEVWGGWIIHRISFFFFSFFLVLPDEISALIASRSALWD